MNRKANHKIKSFFTAFLLISQFNPLLFSASPVYAVDAPDIIVVKEDDSAANILPGQTVTYNIDVSSSGGDATGVVVTEELPDYTTFDSWYLDNAIANSGFELGDFTGWDDTNAGSGLSVIEDVEDAGEYFLYIGSDGAGSEDGYIEQELCPQVPVNDVSEFSLLGQTNYDGVGVQITVTYTDGSSTTVLDYARGTDPWPTSSWSKKDLKGELTAGETIKKITIRGSQRTSDWGGGWNGSFDDIILKVNLGGPPFVYERCLLEEGDPLSFTFIVDVDDLIPSGADFITNTVEVSADGVLPVTTTDKDSLIVPDIILSKDDGVTEVAPGGTLIYTIEVKNLGNQDATGVEVEEAVPKFTTFNASSSAPTIWSCLDGNCSYDLGPLPVGPENAVSLKFAVDVGVSPVPAGVEFITNTVEVSADGVLPVTTTDKDSLIAAPDLEIVKSDGGVSEVLAGGTVAYNLICINTGTQDTTGVVVKETVPKYTIFSASGSFCPLEWSCANGAPAGTKCYCEVGSLPVGASRNLSFAVTVAATISGVDQITNTASIYDDGLSGLDLDLGDNKATDVTSVNPGEIAAIATVAEEEEETVEEAPEEREVKGVEEVSPKEEEPVAEEEEEACQDPRWWILILLLQGILSFLVSRFGKEWGRNAFVTQIVLTLLAVLILRQLFCTWWLFWVAMVLGLGSLYLTFRKIRSPGKRRTRR